MRALRYRAPGGAAALPFALVVGKDSADEQRFPFARRIEIGRREAGAPEYEGRLLVDDASVSSLHCVIVRGPDGRCFVRDTSRNGTWLDGVRLIPNREQEIRPGQALNHEVFHVLTVIGAACHLAVVEVAIRALG